MKWSMKSTDLYVAIISREIHSFVCFEVIGPSYVAQKQDKWKKLLV